MLEAMGASDAELLICCRAAEPTRAVARIGRRRGARSGSVRRSRRGRARHRTRRAARDRSRGHRGSGHRHRIAVHGRRGPQCPASRLTPATPERRDRATSLTGAMSNRTLVLCKPDAVERGLVGEIVGRLERKGLTIRAHRAAHDRRRPGGPPLRRAPREAVLRRSRRVHHPWAARRDGGRGRPRHVEGRAHADGHDEPPRGGARARSAATSPSRPSENLVHGSDGPESAEREIALFFPGLGVDEFHVARRPNPATIGRGPGGAGRRTGWTAPGGGRSLGHSHRPEPSLS